MHISEINAGMTAQIVAARGVRTMEFETKVIDVNVEEMTMKIEPIYRENKLVGFDIEGIMLVLFIINSSDGKVYQFNGISIHSFKDTEGNIYQEVSFNNPEGRVANRRGAIRVWLGMDGKVKLGNAVEEHAVTIKDISATGIAFICDENTEVEMGMPLTITFSDEKSRKPFILTANVVRYADIEDHRRIVYGCRFKNESDMVSKYVNEKQREKLKATRTIDRYRKS